MLKIIQTNPYRLLGVYSTSSQKEVVANQGKMKAFLKVGRDVSFPLDLNGILPVVSRTEENVADANSKLTLPAEQLKYAQFWFAKCTQIDEIACGKLTNGDIEGAIEIWSKKATASSLQNLIVCALIKNQLGNTIKNAEALYSSYENEFVKMVLGDNALATSENLAHDFLNVLCEELNPNQFIGFITNAEWKEYVGSKSTKPLIDRISSAIDKSKSTKGKGAVARLNAGTKLMNDTKPYLSQFKQYVSPTDLQYQMIVDKLGLEILQCGIDYYNDSKEDDAANKAMVLQSYAQSIVVGKMAKDRCNENVNILKKIISELPPIEVFAEDKSIKDILVAFTKQSNKIYNSVSLLNNTKDNLASIKNKLGATSSYYLKLSTIVVNCALGNVIEEVNQAQNRIQSFEDYQAENDVFGGLFGRIDPFSSIHSSSRFSGYGLHDTTTLYNEWVRVHNQQVNDFKKVAQAAWDAIKLMDKFDLEPEFKRKRYDENRRILKGLCEKVGISTSTWSSGGSSGIGCMVVIAIMVVLGVLASCL